MDVNQALATSFARGAIANSVEAVAEANGVQVVEGATGYLADILSGQASVIIGADGNPVVATVGGKTLEDAIAFQLRSPLNKALIAGPSVAARREAMARSMLAGEVRRGGLDRSFGFPNGRPKT
jgi:hypothetical protein